MSRVIRFGGKTAIGAGVTYLAYEIYTLNIDFEGTLAAITGIMIGATALATSAVTDTLAEGMVQDQTPGQQG